MAPRRANEHSAVPGWPDPLFGTWHMISYIRVRAPAGVPGRWFRGRLPAPWLVSDPHPLLTGRPVQVLIEIGRRLDIHPANYGVSVVVAEKPTDMADLR